MNRGGVLSLREPFPLTFIWEGLSVTNAESNAWHRFALRSVFGYLRLCNFGFIASMILMGTWSRRSETAPGPSWWQSSRVPDSRYVTDLSEGSSAADPIPGLIYITLGRGGYSTVVTVCSFEGPKRWRFSFRALVTSELIWGVQFLIEIQAQAVSEW